LRVYVIVKFSLYSFVSASKMDINEQTFRRAFDLYYIQWVYGGFTYFWPLNASVEWDKCCLDGCRCPSYSWTHTIPPAHLSSWKFQLLWLGKVSVRSECRAGYSTGG
jgi:hypothetical protein